MASNSAKKQVHVSPGIYFSESELPIATRSLGITNLGLAGETLKGPAFQIVNVSSWSQYQSYFGGTSTEKFKGSQYPKYELPYIAKSYLEESQSLKVCRVLGLSGTNAGTAWIITAWGDPSIKPKEGGYTYTKDKPMVVAVIRSRGEHRKATYIGPARPEEGICEDEYSYDGIYYYAKQVRIVKSKSFNLDGTCSKGFNPTTHSFNINANNYGTFGLEVTTPDNEVKTYSVSFNPGDKNYIYNVIGGNPEVGDAEIYVEELYDVALQQLIEQGELNTLGDERVLPHFNVARIVPEHQEVIDILTEDESMLRWGDVGKRFVYSSINSVSDSGNPITVHKLENGDWNPVNGVAGHIYTVVAHTNANGTRSYYYGEEGDGEVLGEPTVDTEGILKQAVFVRKYNTYYILGANSVDIEPVTLDFDNYKEQYRYSSTPWIVSELKGSAEDVELTKLFRFHTISDGDASITEVKISIENIEPSNGTFDVIVRDFNDTDASPVILERFRGLNLVPGNENYIALRIGSFNEDYESKSRYVTVEVNENEKTAASIPSGFLGYPVRDYKGKSISPVLGEGVTELQKPYLQYNVNVYDGIRVKKQYFGMSDIVGIDYDILKYKGVEAYTESPSGLTPSFHLDSRILDGTPDENGRVNKYQVSQSVSVDGVNGYTWVTVGKGNTVGNLNVEPRIGTDEEMLNTIYEDKRWRKFTLCFYGGYDGWDYYRTSRSNTDEFKYQKYRGYISKVSGEGATFSIMRDTEAFGFQEGEIAITSDWYAYLAAIRQFANPKDVDINVLATPGIDYVNNNSLVDEVIDMVEEERADSIYVVTTPDKPFGADDSKSEMYTAADAVDNLELSDIDSNWACTYYPWIKYYDSANSQYIYLPPTKDVVRNFAYTDNVAAPWYVPAGWNRGISDGIKSKKSLLIGEQDELYSGRINFINNFAEEGMRIWGDKNLQVAESKAHMNRISKRRCLIRLRKLISIACIGLVFEPNDDTNTASFRSAVQPILDDFMSKRALNDAKLVIDNSEEARDRLEINAQIYIKFTPNTEYINIGLVATPQGVSFDDI